MTGTLSHDGITGAESLRIVIACQMGGNSTFRNEVTFEELTVNGERIPFTVPNEVTAADITLADVLLALRSAVDMETVAAADMNRDGALTLLDILQMLKILVK